MSSPDEYIRNIRKQLALGKISQEVYLELKAEFETMTAEEAKCPKINASHTASSSSGINLGDASVLRENTITSTTHNTKNEFHGPREFNVNVNGERVHVTKTGELCPICNGLVRDDYFKCLKCNRNYIHVRHQDPKSYLCENCERIRLKEEEEHREEEDKKKRDAEERRIQATKAKQQAEEATRIKAEQERLERERRQFEAEKERLEDLKKKAELVQQKAEDERKRHEELARKKKGEEESLWRSAEQSDTRKAYEGYLNAYPSGFHIKEAQAAIREICRQDEEVHPRQDEELAWVNCKRNDSIPLYESYNKKYPQGRYVKEASEAIARHRREYTKSNLERAEKEAKNSEDWKKCAARWKSELNDQECEQRCLEKAKVLSRKELKDFLLFIIGVFAVAGIFSFILALIYEGIKMVIKWLG